MSSKKKNFAQQLKGAKRVNVGIFEQEFEDVCPISNAAEAAHSRKVKNNGKKSKEEIFQDEVLIATRKVNFLLDLFCERMSEKLKYDKAEMERQNEREEADHQVYLKHKKLEELRAQAEILELTEKIKAHKG